MPVRPELVVLVYYVLLQGCFVLGHHLKFLCGGKFKEFLGCLFVHVRIHWHFTYAVKHCWPKLGIGVLVAKEFPWALKRFSRALSMVGHSRMRGKAEHGENSGNIFFCDFSVPDGGLEKFCCKDCLMVFCFFDLFLRAFF